MRVPKKNTNTSAPAWSHRHKKKSAEASTGPYFFKTCGTSDNQFTS